MRLFNKANLLKMLIPDSYELFLFKLGFHLFFKLGVVKLRGDRYVYGDQNVIQIKWTDPLVEINLFNPAGNKTDRIEQEESGITPVVTLYILPGQNCAEELKIIHDHIRHVNVFDSISKYDSIEQRRSTNLFHRVLR